MINCLFCIVSGYFPSNLFVFIIKRIYFAFLVNNGDVDAGREELRKENPLHLTNLAWILGVELELTPSGSRLLGHVGAALLNCLNLILETSTEEDIETVAIQVILFYLLPLEFFFFVYCV